MSLRKQIIRLANERPELRKNLLPLLKEGQEVEEFEEEEPGNWDDMMLLYIDNAIDDLKMAKTKRGNGRVGEIAVSIAELLQGLRDCKGSTGEPSMIQKSLRELAQSLRYTAQSLRSTF